MNVRRTTMQCLLGALLFAAPALAENIDVVPTSSDFGAVLVGDSATTTFTYTGMADGAIIDSVTIFGDLAGAFALEIPLDPAMPIFLDLGDTAEHDVTFTPPGALAALPLLGLMGVAHAWRRRRCRGA